ncbi:MAG: J domain-containing protein [Methylococcus sp.]
MASFRTHYDNLKVARNAPDSVIRAAYKALMQHYHPDKYEGEPQEAERMTKIIQDSFLHLSDPDKRRRHDLWIKEEEQKRQAAGDVWHIPTGRQTRGMDTPAQGPARHAAQRSSQSGHEADYKIRGQWKNRPWRDRLTRIAALTTVYMAIYTLMVIAYSVSCGFMFCAKSVDYFMTLMGILMTQILLVILIFG